MIQEGDRGWSDRRIRGEGWGRETTRERGRNLIGSQENIVGKTMLTLQSQEMCKSSDIGVKNYPSIQTSLTRLHGFGERWMASQYRQYQSAPNHWSINHWSHQPRHSHASIVMKVRMVIRIGINWTKLQIAEILCVACIRLDYASTCALVALIQTLHIWFDIVHQHYLFKLCISCNFVSTLTWIQFKLYVLFWAYRDGSTIMYFCVASYLTQ